MKTKILIVDDEAVVRGMIERTFARDCYHLFNACNGVQGIELAHTEKPDLILLDIGMPEKDGRQVLQELRNDAKTQMIPVILLTGYGGMEDKILGLDDGADDYVTKPFDVRELRARVANLLRRHAQQISANPLTKLPGSPSIEEQVTRRYRKDAPFSFSYIDIDHFKAFNDAYGYAEGDVVIRETAAMILDCLKTCGDPGDFLGHIGGDDFVMITHPRNINNLAEEIAQRFDRRCKSYHNIEDRYKGYIASASRQGRPQRFPLMTLSIAVTHAEKRRFEHYADLVNAVTEIKLQLKSRGNFKRSALMIDRSR